jgi:hypothetical protein
MDWLIDYLGFYVPLKNFSLIWRHHHCRWRFTYMETRHHCRWRATKFRPMLGAQGLLAGRYLYRATPAETRDLGFSGLIWRTAPFSRLWRQTRGCGGSLLTWILTGLIAGCNHEVLHIDPPHNKCCTPMANEVSELDEVPHLLRAPTFLKPQQWQVSFLTLG